MQTKNSPKRRKREGTAMHHHARKPAPAAEPARQWKNANATLSSADAGANLPSEDFWLELNPASPLDEPEILPPMRPMPAPEECLEERINHEQWDDVPPMDR
jgi:hypothetical protein